MTYPPKASEGAATAPELYQREPTVTDSCQAKTAAAGASVRTSSNRPPAASRLLRAAPAKAAIEHHAAVRSPGRVAAARLSIVIPISLHTSHCPAMLTTLST